MEDAKIWPVCCRRTLIGDNVYREINTTAAKRIYWSSGVCNILVEFSVWSKLSV